MTQEPESKLEVLEKEFPNLYENCPIGVGEGWYKIIRKISEDLTKWNSENPDKQVKPVQVKEKFGGLRYYTDVCFDETSKMISDAEHLADICCESCGLIDKKKVKSRGGGWIVTLCDKCYEEDQVQRKLAKL